VAGNVDDESARFAQLFTEFVDGMREVAQSRRVPGVKQRLESHLAMAQAQLPVVSQEVSTFNHVNIQIAIDSWLGEPGRSHELIGMVGPHRHYGSLADLGSIPFQMEIGAPDLVNLPSGLNETRVCVNFGLYLIMDHETPIAMMVRGPDEMRPHRQNSIVVEVVSPDPERAPALLSDLSELMVRLNIFRGQIVSFRQPETPFGRMGSVTFHRRPDLTSDQLVLPEDTLSSIERQVFGINEQRDRLIASGQHVKRGILLHGPPGCGKTHTIRYLVARLRDHTVVLLTGGDLSLIESACSLARTLQPAVVVMEDVDLVAQHRQAYPGGNPVLFEILNQIEGMQEDSDVTFVLTTNRADLLEPALAARPGRVDLAVEIGLPDEDGRRKLIELYGRGLDLRIDDLDRVVDRTAGVTAAFIKELMRKAALAAALRSEDGARITVTEDDVLGELEEFLSEKNVLTRVLLGSETERSGGDPRTGWLTSEPRFG
jgi:hypothetical protein